ncbi:serine hydrolase-like protein 2 [Plutella xylostella]|nr:serine hydrolase-like protein 2 [Plutella xylostella]
MSLNEKEWFIEAPWGRLSIVAWGDCFDPPVLLVHGRVDSAATFRPLLKLLPRKFYYIGLELPGNGRSDPFPPGLMLNAYDLVYSLRVVVKHFRWEKFVYVGHSLGTLLGKIYNLSYPDEMTQVVELDPTPMLFSVAPDQFASWYHEYFTKFYNKYDKFNAPKETAPLYTKEKAIDMLKTTRGLTDEAAHVVLERISEPAGGGMIRYTFDQRIKMSTTPPLSAEQKEKLFTALPTPTLTIVAETSLQYGYYDKTPFALDEAAYPAKNYRVRKVAGNHDVHVSYPERLATYVHQFLLYGLDGLDNKAKL